MKIELNRDWSEFLSALIFRQVRFLLIGGHAVAGHGEPRLTEVLAGRGAAAREAIEGLVKEMEALFEESRKPGWTPEPDAPNTPAHGLVAVLDIRFMLAAAEKDTTTSLRLVNRQLEVQRLSGAAAEDIALSLGNRGIMRKNANDLEGAEQDLLEAAGIFTQANHGLHRAKCLSSLARVTEKRGNLARAVELGLEALQLSYQVGDLGDISIAHNNVSYWLTTLGRHAEACLHAAAALFLFTLFRPDPWVPARRLQNALAASGPGAQPPDLAALERAFPRLVPLLMARKLTRAALETHFANVLAQRESLAAQAEHHDRRAQLVQLRSVLQDVAAGLAANDAEAAEIVASDDFRNLLSQFDISLSPELPPTEAVATALARVHADIASIDEGAAKDPALGHP